MASLYIKDPATADRVDRLAKRWGTTKTALVGRALDALERVEPLPPLDEDDAGPTDPVAWVKWHRARHPLPPKVRETDKAFFDRMWGEPD